MRKLQWGTGLVGLLAVVVALGIVNWPTSHTPESDHISASPFVLRPERGTDPSLVAPSQHAPHTTATQMAVAGQERQPERKAGTTKRLKAALALTPDIFAKESYAAHSETEDTRHNNLGITGSVEDPQCQDVARDEGNLRHVMGWSPKTLAKAQSLTGLSPKELCILPLMARDQLRNLIKETQKADANGMIEYLESRHRDETGKVPVDGLYKAVQQHNALLEQQVQRERLSAPQVAGISPPVWTAMGPKNTYSGRVRALHIDPRNSAMMLVGTASGGLWRTTDAGTTWLPVDSFSPAFSITGLRADPNNLSTIYASTGEMFTAAGIWRSLDNGVTWQSIPAVAPGQLIRGRVAGTDMTVGQLTYIAVSPTSSQIIVVAAGYGGALVSRDGGVSWQQVAIQANYVSGTYTYSALPATYFASFDPKDGRKVFVGTNRGTVIIGTGIGTGSEQWQEQTIAAQTAGTLVTTLAWSKDGSSAWLTTSEAQGTVYRSTDGGVTFTKLSAPGYCEAQCWYNNSLWVDPTNSSRIVLGGVGLYRSIDGGLTWESIDLGLNYSWNHVDHHALLADPGYNGTTNKTVYFGNDGGVFRTVDITGPVWGNGSTPANAFTWVNFGKGIDATQFYAMDANSTAGIILGGTQDNGTFRFQSGTDWTTLTGWDGGYPGVPSSGTPLYSSHQNFAFWRTPYSATNPSGDYICDGITDASTTYRYSWNSTTNTWDQQLVCGVAGQLNKSLFIAPLILDQNLDKRMYAGGESLWASNDVSTGIPVWRVIKPSLVASNGYVPKVSAIAVAPGDVNNVWVGYTNGEAYRTANALATTPTWILARAVLPNSYEQVTSIYISPTSPQRVTITMSGYASGSTAKNVLRTVDAGTNWSDISGNLPKTVAHSVVEHPTNANSLYVGTDTGIYATTDGITWSASNDGPARVPVYMLKWYDNSTLLAATHGRGVWRATVGNLAPGVPTQVTGSIGNSQVTVTFAAPLSDGGSPITGYTVTWSPAGGTDNSAGTTALTHTITGLSNGTAYTFTVKARNALGEGAASAPSAIAIPAETLIAAGERSALLNLYASTNGPSWTNKTNWGGPGCRE